MPAMWVRIPHLMSPNPLLSPSITHRPAHCLAPLAYSTTASVEFGTVGTPMQCIQIKMAHDAYSLKPKFKGFFSAAYHIVKDEGETVLMNAAHIG